MNGQESQNKQLEAYKLYISGLGIDAVAKQLKVSTATLFKWVKNFNWQQDRDKLKNESRTKVYGSIETERERTLKLIHGAEALIASRIQDKSIKGDLSSFAAIERVKWDIIEPQKTRVNIEGDAFTFTITCGGSNGNTDKLGHESETARGI